MTCLPDFKVPGIPGFRNLTSASAPVPRLTARGHLQRPAPIFILSQNTSPPPLQKKRSGKRKARFWHAHASSCFVCSKALSWHRQQRSGIILPRSPSVALLCQREPLVCAPFVVSQKMYNENNSKTIARVCRAPFMPLTL